MQHICGFLYLQDIIFASGRNYFLNQCNEFMQTIRMGYSAMSNIQYSFKFKA